MQNRYVAVRLSRSPARAADRVTGQMAGSCTDGAANDTPLLPNCLCIWPERIKTTTDGNKDPRAFGASTRPPAFSADLNLNALPKQCTTAKSSACVIYINLHC